MATKSEPKTELVDTTNKKPVNTADKTIVLSLQQVISYTLFILTVGASIYTFFKAIPKIDELDESVTQLRVSNGRVEERINALKETLVITKNK